MFAIVTAAAETAAEIAGEAARHTQESGGLPQLNPNDFAPQLIWLAIMFGLLYIIIARIAAPRVSEVLVDRQDRIKRDLEAAEDLKSETDAALAEYEKALGNARANASAIAKDKRQELANETEAEKAKVEADLNAKLQDAENRIAETKAKALASVNEIAGDTAQLIVTKLLGQDVGADEINSALPAEPGK